MHTSLELLLNLPQLCLETEQNICDAGRREVTWNQECNGVFRRQNPARALYWRRNNEGKTILNSENSTTPVTDNSFRVSKHTLLNKKTPAEGLSYGGRITLLSGIQPAEEFSTLGHEIANKRSVLCDQLHRSA